MSFVGFNDGVVMLIGGAGCLGQHIIRELQLSDFSEIRVFDTQSYVKKLGMSLDLIFILIFHDSFYKGFCAPRGVHRRCPLSKSNSGGRGSTD